MMTAGFQLGGGASPSSWDTFLASVTPHSPGLSLVSLAAASLSPTAMPLLYRILNVDLFQGLLLGPLLLSIPSLSIFVQHSINSIESLPDARLL